MQGTLTKLQCSDCSIRDNIVGEPNPHRSERIGAGRPQVLFVGHVLNGHTLRPFAGREGVPLRQEIEWLDLRSYIITNVFRCRLAHQTNSGKLLLGERCFNLLRKDLDCFSPLVVTLGSPALRFFTGCNGSDLGLLPPIITVSFEKYEFELVALSHPHTLNYEQSYRNSWRKGWENIAEYLERRD